MADDNDKLTLSRRKVLGGAATIGMAGALGAGTWAQMSDEETARVNAQSGSIDLKANGDDNEVSLDFGSNLQNGDSETKTIALKNTGSLPGRSLCFYIPSDSLSDEEGDLLDAEEDAGDASSDDGELDNVADVGIDFDGEEIDRIDNGQDLDAFSIAGSENRNCINGDPVLSADGGTGDLDVSVTLPDENVNEAMTDSFGFDLVFTLYDEEQ